MKKSLLKALYSILAVAFWLVIYEVFSRRINLGFILPGLKDTFIEFISLFSKRSFYESVATSLLRIIIGYALGAALGMILALASFKLKLVNYMLSPLITVLKATPVASFILVIWFILGSHLVPIAIALIMVMPIIYQNLIDGHAAIDPRLNEVCDVYDLSYRRRLRILILPTLIRFLIPGLITSCGLAWKSGIAAEIICYTKNSLGQSIVDAKNYFESARMLAVTAVVIILSIIIEKLFTRLLKRRERV